MERARDATSDARDRFDFGTRAEYENLERRVAALEVLLGVEHPVQSAEAASSDAAEDPSRDAGSAPSQAASGEAGDPSATD
ncbi:MAG: hypothetical protein HKO98_02620 [Gemmatimonadetes bacterium]|nr:hypothetical protein [Gemmatimonadota bacterium]